MHMGLKSRRAPWSPRASRYPDPPPTLQGGQVSKWPVFLMLTNTDPFAAWFVVTGDVIPDGIHVVRSVLGANCSLLIVAFQEQPMWMDKTCTIVATGFAVPKTVTPTPLCVSFFWLGISPLWYTPHLFLCSNVIEPFCLYTQTLHAQP